LRDTSFITFLQGKLLYHISGKMRTLDENATVAERIHFYRTQRNMKGDTLAEEIGMSRYAIMAYENSRTEPSLSDLDEMAAVFEIEVDKLYDDYYKFLAYPYSEKIKEIRKDKNLYQRELAEILSVATNTVKRWEWQENTVSRETWDKLKDLELL